mgnify:CR=1 FL=1
MQAPENKTQRDCRGSACESLPLAILALAICLFFVFQLQQAAADRTTLRQVREGQSQALAQSKEVQERLDLLAVATVQLADSGNANAKALVERMKQAGITINPNKAAATPEASPPTVDPAVK